jgi:Spy/CpxP family protein refolding chaperone
MKILAMLLILFAVRANSYAQENIPSDKDRLLKGEAAGETLVAEMNGYSSTQKVLALQDQLGLTKSQLKKIDEILKNTLVSITVKGQEIIEEEEALHKLFTSPSINEQTLRIKLDRIGKLRAELRFAHLQIYLKTKQILTAPQWERLRELKSNEGK